MSFLSTANESILSENIDLISTRVPQIEKELTVKVKFPQRLKKTFYLSLGLFIVGIILLIVCLEEMIRQDDFWAGWHFLAISVIVLIPGTYYSIQFLRARLAKDPDVSGEIYDTIPELGN
jgi:hypothetical protein